MCIDRHCLLYTFNSPPWSPYTYIGPIAKGSMKWAGVREELADVRETSDLKVLWGLFYNFPARKKKQIRYIRFFPRLCTIIIAYLHLTVP